jgi:hypothetical protein
MEMGYARVKTWLERVAAEITGPENIAAGPLESHIMPIHYFKLI